MNLSSLGNRTLVSGPQLARLVGTSVVRSTKKNTPKFGAKEMDRKMQLVSYFVQAQSKYLPVWTKAPKHARQFVLYYRCFSHRARMKRDYTVHLLLQLKLDPVLAQHLSIWPMTSIAATQITLSFCDVYETESKRLSSGLRHELLLRCRWLMLPLITR